MFFLCLKFISIHCHNQKNRKIKINWVKKLSATGMPIKQDSAPYKGCSRNFLTSTPVTFIREYHPPPPPSPHHPSTLFIPAMQITLCYTSRLQCKQWSTETDGTRKKNPVSHLGISNKTHEIISWNLYQCPNLHYKDWNHIHSLEWLFFKLGL